MTAEPPQRSPQTGIKFGFDQREKTYWKVFGTPNPWESLLPAWRSRRLVEEAGVPASVDHTDLSGQLLHKIIRWTTEEFPQVADSLLLRVCEYDQDENFSLHFSNFRIARLSDAQATNLAGMLEVSLDHTLTRIREGRSPDDSEHDRQFYLLGRARVALELLSRLVLRLPYEAARKIIDRALRYYESSVIRHHHWLIEPFGKLFLRSFESLAPAERAEYLLRLTELPIPHYENFDPVDVWPDPFDPLKSVDEVPPRPRDNPVWDQAVARLLAAARTHGPRARPKAIHRLMRLHRWGLLNNSECADFADALWNGAAHRRNPPIDTELLDWAFLFLPEPNPGEAERVFRERYFSQSHWNIQDVTSGESLLNLCYATEPDKFGNAALTLTAEEVCILADRMIQAWRQNYLKYRLSSDVSGDIRLYLTPKSRFGKGAGLEVEGEAPTH